MMGSRAILKVPIEATAKVLVLDPCPFGLPVGSAVAHVK